MREAGYSEESPEEKIERFKKMGETSAENFAKKLKDMPNNTEWTHRDSIDKDLFALGGWDKEGFYEGFKEKLDEEGIERKDGDTIYFRVKL